MPRDGAEEFHSHKPKDVRPQGEGSGLDADKIHGNPPISKPPPGSGGKRIKNFWWDPATQQIVVEAED